MIRKAKAIGSNPLAGLLAWIGRGAALAMAPGNLRAARGAP